MLGSQAIWAPAHPGWMVEPSTASGRARAEAEAFLGEIYDQLKAREFVPLPVREPMIPKATGKLRRLGIPTVADRVVQAAL